MVSFFSRTSTHKVLDICLEYNTQDVKFITKKLNSRGHTRTENDIKQMIKHLIQVGILNNDLVKSMIKIIKKNIENGENQNLDLIHLLLEYLTKNGLMIMPFLEAVEASPDIRSKSKFVGEKTVEKAKKYGVYHLRYGQDINAAMKNFSAYLGLMVDKPRVYELTKLGKRIIGASSESISLLRVKCDVGEPCREICPTGAISWQIINNNCIECSLCTNACPYGAITINCGMPSQINTVICKNHSSTKQMYEACSPTLIKADELIMQNWIKSVFNITNLPSEIPGIGKYPDIVTKTKTSSFIEVKKNRITTKSIDNLYLQLKKYMQEEIINNTLLQLKKRHNFVTVKPRNFVVIAPESKNINNLLSRTSDLPLPTSFVSYEVIYELSNSILQGNNYDLSKIWMKMENDDYSDVIRSLI